MAKRYFRSTDGHITVFRATASKAYQSAFFASTQDDNARWVRSGPIGFSATSATEGAHLRGHHPAEEIVQSEYEALVAHKNTRLKARGLHPARYNSPQESWVSNAALT